MSSTVVSRNRDLKRLRDEGYDVSVKQGYLFVKDVPLVNGRGEVGRGTLVSTLALTGETVEAPETHVVMLIGDYPCEENGTPIAQLKHEGAKDLGGGVKVDFSFSNKPEGGFPDYHAKMSHYANIIEGPAQALDPDVTAKTFPAFAPDEEDDTPFRYVDTATSRANTGAINERLKLARVAIVGDGGTGSYVLDYVAKTPVREIHLFDEDLFSSHNAFRSPGAASLDELHARPTKVAYLAAIYGKMRTGIVAHEDAVTAENVSLLEGMDFVFLCIDESVAKAPIVDALERMSIAFVDVGMGLDTGGGALGGVVRTTLSTPAERGVLRENVSLAEVAGNGEYDTSIQIVELNALNAALAVVKWKKHFGFYRDYAASMNSTFTIDTEALAREEPDDEV
jgi:ThiF family